MIQQRKRHRKNTNLTLHWEKTYKDLPLLAKYQPYILEYLDAIYQVMGQAVEQHRRTLAIRIELRFPQYMTAPDDNSVISRFIASLGSQIESDIARRRRAGKRVPDTGLRYIRVRECSRALNHHYHMVIFVNMDTYYSLGDFNAVEGNMAAWIKRAWSRALGLTLEESSGAVFFPRNAVYRLNLNNQWAFAEVWQSLFKRLSYFAKSRTKQYGNHNRSFDCSRR